MTRYEEFLVFADSYRHKHPAQRRGQAHFNALTEWDPPLAEKVRGTPLDPFYGDEVIPDFLAFVRANWSPA